MDASPFLIMHGLADSSVPHGQSVLLYEALKAKGKEATLRLIDRLPHTFFNRTDLDEVAGPFRMDVRDRVSLARDQLVFPPCRSHPDSRGTGQSSSPAR